MGRSHRALRARRRSPSSRLLTFRDYGLGWDDYTHSQYGELLLTLYGSGFTERPRALLRQSLHLWRRLRHGGGALSPKFCRSICSRRAGSSARSSALSASSQPGGSAAVSADQSAGLIALVLLATCPLFDGHMFINAKDAPFATAMIVLLLAHRAGARRISARPRARTVALFGVGARTGVWFAHPCRGVAHRAVRALGMIVIRRKPHSRYRAAAANAHVRNSSGPCCRRWRSAICIMGLLWPWSFVTPLNPLARQRIFLQVLRKAVARIVRGQIDLRPRHAGALSAAAVLR